MLWSEIRASHPNQWLVVEGINARSENELRIVEDAEVIEECPDGNTALKRCAVLQREQPRRDLYPLHTSWEKIEIPERWRVPIRGDFRLANPR